MVRLADEIDWERFDTAFGSTYSDKGRPGISTRLMVALHYLKYTFDLSDEDVILGWIENPYWQYLSGMRFFEHRFPINPSSMSRWRRRVGESGAEELLTETIQTGLRLSVIRRVNIRRVNVDTTVQEKHIRFPTDARLYNRMRERLVKQAQAEGVMLRQSYVRVGKRLLVQQSRYAHARQFKRAAHCTRRLCVILGRVIRDIERKAKSPSAALSELLALAKRLFAQQKLDKNKLYSIHAPEVECISKGKSHKRYEFGCKVSLGVSSRGGWVLAAKAVHGNPFDGHTLAMTMDQLKRMVGKSPEHVYVDMGYRGHDYEGDCEVVVGKRRRGRTPARVWRWMKRRAAIEPTIGHLKEDKRMNRNRLKGREGDAVNVLLSGAAMNFKKLLGALAPSLRIFRPGLWLFSTPIEPDSI
jgi:IS5 family transposase